MTFFDHGSVHMILRPAGTKEVHVSQRGKRIFVQELAGLIERGLN